MSGAAWFVVGALVGAVVTATSIYGWRWWPRPGAPVVRLTACVPRFPAAPSAMPRPGFVVRPRPPFDQDAPGHTGKVA